MPLRRGEWGLALFLYFLLTVMVGADWVGKLGADALFVKRYGVQNVPFMYIMRRASTGLTPASSEGFSVTR